MTRYDWHALQPARALSPDDPRYVPRPWGGGDRLAVLVRNGLTPIALTGPLGSGKTTELRRALALLGETVHGVEVPADLLVPLDDLSPDVLLWELARYLLDHVLERDPDLRPSRALVDDIRASDPRLPRGGGIHRKPLDLVRLVLAEVADLVDHERVGLLIDGLDKAQPDRARAAIRALLPLQHDDELVVVVSPALANGPRSHEVLAHMRVWWLPSIPADSEEGLRYLRRIVTRRLERRQLPKSLKPVADRAAAESGGVTRTFLRLVQDAALYATAEGRVRPTPETLSHAIRDRADAMRRILVAGDLEALANALGTDGLEIPEDRKIRLLAHNALLEYPDGEGSVVRPHPLLAPLLARRTS